MQRTREAFNRRCPAMSTSGMTRWREYRESSSLLNARSSARALSIMLRFIACLGLGQIPFDAHDALVFKALERFRKDEITSAFAVVKSDAAKVAPACAW